MKILTEERNPFGGIDEQSMTNQVEDAVGGPDQCFRLMDIYDGSKRISKEQHNPFRIGHGSQKPETVEEVFRRKAQANSFTNRQIDAFIDYRSVM